MRSIGKPFNNVGALGARCAVGFMGHRGGFFVWFGCEDETMMKIQYQAIVDSLYRLLDDQLDIETEEGRQAFVKMSQALFEVYAEAKFDQAQQ